MTVGPKQWNVMLIDDEPDVLSVSKLALQNVNIDRQSSAAYPNCGKQS